jgi:crotonobetainyl-CoA:carnitine CoA-transferase CaiB-like acyl-CoA transferase
MPEGPLSELVVLDLTRVLAGPWATQMLADIGATVLKIERPGTGDETRQWGPPYLKDRDGRQTTESAYYLSANRGKRSLAIDLASLDGQALVRTLARWGLDYRSLESANERLIYLSISAFGQDGPAAAEPGYDAMIQAMGGLMSITGVPDGEPGAGPQKVGVAVADLMCGMYAVVAVLAALHERHRSGRGQYVDLALLDTQVAWLANQGLNYLVSGAVPVRRGTAHPNIVPYQAFASADGYLMLAVGNDGQFARFCAVAGLDALATDSRYATNAQRVANRAQLTPRLAAALAGRPTTQWLRLLREADVPCGPINDLAQVFHEPQVRHRGMRVDLAHPVAGSVPSVRNPIRYSRTPLEPGAAPPLLGADTDAVLAERLGLDAAALADLRRRGVIGGTPLCHAAAPGR